MAPNNQPDQITSKMHDLPSHPLNMGYLKSMELHLTVELRQGKIKINIQNFYSQSIKIFVLSCSTEIKKNQYLVSNVRTMALLLQNFDFSVRLSNDHPSKW